MLYNYTDSSCNNQEKNGGMLIIVIFRFLSLEIENLNGHEYHQQGRIQDSS